MASYECHAPNLSTCQPLVLLGFSVLLLSGEACIKYANPEGCEMFFHFQGERRVNTSQARQVYTEIPHKDPQTKAAKMP